MAKIKIDVSHVEPGTDFDTPVPRGAYRCKIADVKHGQSKSSGADMLTVEYEIIHGEWKGRKLWDYIVLNESSEWKLRQFTDALGKRPKTTLDTDAINGEVVLVRVKHETDDRDADNPVVRARVGSVNQVPDADAEDEDDDEPDDDEPDEDEEEDEEEDDDDESEEDEEDGEEEEYTREDVDGFSRADLKDLIEEEELEVSFNAKTKLPVLRDRVAEALGLDGEEEEPDQDYGDMSIADLRTEAKARGLSSKGPKAKLVTRLEEDDNDGEPF